MQVSEIGHVVKQTKWSGLPEKGYSSRCFFVHVFARTPVRTLLERSSPMKGTEPVAYCALRWSLERACKIKNNKNSVMVHLSFHVSFKSFSDCQFSKTYFISVFLSSLIFWSLPVFLKRYWEHTLLMKNVCLDSNLHHATQHTWLQ